jgi:hypothetical protein
MSTFFTTLGHLKFPSAAALAAWRSGHADASLYSDLQVEFVGPPPERKSNVEVFADYIDVLSTDGRRRT